jgi:CO2 hydration protein
MLDPNQNLNHALTEVLARLEAGGALLPDSQQNVVEVVGVLKSYGVVLDAYWRNLIYIANHQFLVLLPTFKYFNGEVSIGKLLKHWWHDRINYEFAEYCMKAMFWHGGGGMDSYLDTEEFKQQAKRVIQAKTKGNPVMQLLDRLFPDFLLEQVRQMAYYNALGLFWEEMAPLFLDLSDRYDKGEIQTIPQVVQHVQNGLVASASKPITYSVEIRGQVHEIIPASAGLTFLMDAAVPYVQAVFLRSFPFRGTVSYNAQAQFVPGELSKFNYGVLYADPIPVGGAGIPPTLLMQDMRHSLPDYLHQIYQQSERGEDDLRVQICASFQKSMFCVTTAAIRGLAPFAIGTEDIDQQQTNRNYLKGWISTLADSRLLDVQDT